MNAYQATVDTIQKVITLKQIHITQYTAKILEEKNDFQKKLYQDEMNTLLRDVVALDRELVAMTSRGEVYS